MATLTDAWNAAARAAPLGWRVQGLKCKSASIGTNIRHDRWVAEACGPAEACLMVNSATPDDALWDLATRLRELA